jgi:hypothetical protein
MERRRRGRGLQALASKLLEFLRAPLFVFR